MSPPRSPWYSIAKAFALGILWLAALGCADTDQEIYLAGDPGLATITNTLKAPIYLPGCAPFTTERSLDGSWVDLGPPFVCAWEGIAVELAPKQSLETPFTAPTDTGLYRVKYTLGARCEPDLPLSQANCKFEGLERFAFFEVERELCDPSEFGCQFVPGAPNYLCDDGVHFGGPSGECTRDPVSGDCGYEFLSCP